MTNQLPAREALEQLLLRCLLESGGSMGVKQITEEVAKKAGIQLKDRPTINGSGRRTDLDYKLAWARTSLKKSGCVERISFGQWIITPLGKARIETK